jgi:hypothetical protein
MLVTVSHILFDLTPHTLVCLQQVISSGSTPGGASTSKDHRILASIFDVMAEDLHDTDHPERIKKVFCSQSVVLMLRNALDPNGKNSGLLQSLQRVNSRLVSPKQVKTLLECYGAVSISNDHLDSM